MIITEFLRINFAINKTLEMFEMFKEIRWEEFTYGWFDPVVWIGWLALIVFYAIAVKINRKTKDWPDVSEKIFAELILIPFCAIIIFVLLVIATADSKDWGRVIIYMACETVWWTGIAYAVQGYFIWAREIVEDFFLQK